MQTCAVEAHRLTHLDVVAEGLVGGCCPDAVGIVSLVEHEALEVGLVVEVEVSACEVDLAHAGIGLHFVQHGALRVTHRVGHVVEIGLLGPPELRVLDGQDDDGVVGSRSRFRRDDLLAVKHLDGQRIAIALLVELGADDELLLVDVGRSEYALECHRVDGLHPYGLPNARHAGVAASGAIELGALFAAGLLSAAKVVLDHHDEVGAAAGFHVLRDVDGEGVACAAVAEHFLSVDVDCSVVIDSPEVEQDVLVSPAGRNAEGALVPDTWDEVGVLHSREAALGAEGDGDLAVEALAVAPALLGARLAEVEAIRPGAVQVDPVGTFELRTRILAAGQVRSLYCAAQSEQQECCHEQLADVFHFVCIYYII